MGDDKAKIEALHKDLFNANAFRGLAYTEILTEMRKEFGEEKASEVFKRAIYNLGVKIAEVYTPPAAIKEFKDWLLVFLPAEGALMDPEVISCGDEELVVKFSRCPLKEGWRMAGLGEEEVADMCRHADLYDHGFFGSVFDYSMELWSETPDDSCILHFRPKKKEASRQG